MLDNTRLRNKTIIFCRVQDDDRIVNIIFIHRDINIENKFKKISCLFMVTEIVDESFSF